MCLWGMYNPCAKTVSRAGSGYLAVDPYPSLQKQQKTRRACYAAAIAQSAAPLQSIQ